MPDDIASRWRAACAYSGRPQADLAEALGLSVPTLQRIAAGARPPKPAEIRQLAHETGVPVSYIESGFPGGPQDRESRIEWLAQELARLTSRDPHD